MQKRKVLEKSILIFKAVFIIVMLVSAVPFLHVIISPYIKILLGLGGILILCDFWMGRERWKPKDFWLLIAFAGMYLITVIINREGHFSENLKAWCYMLLIFILMYGYDCKRPLNKVYSEIKIVFRVFLAGTFVLSVICLLTYIFSFNVSYMVEESHMYIGMYDNRLWGLYNPNTGATLNVIAALMSLALFFDSKRAVAWKIFYAVNMAVQGVCLILTGSRAPIYTAVLGIVVLAAVEGSRYFGRSMGTERKKRIRQKIAGGFCVGLAALVLVAGGGTVLKNGLSYVPPMLTESSLYGPTVIKNYKTQNGLSTDKKENKKKENKKKDKDNSSSKKKVDLTRKEKEEDRKGGVLTGRGDLWQAGIHGFLDAPVFGVGRENLYDKCQGYLHDKVWQGSLYDGGLHNIILTILVSSGIAGFSIILIFLIVTIKKLLWYGIREGGFVKDRLFLCLFLILVMFGITEMLEARILYRVGIFYVIFWIIYGYAMNIVRKKKEELG